MDLGQNKRPIKSRLARLSGDSLEEDLIASASASATASATTTTTKASCKTVRWHEQEIEATNLNHLDADRDQHLIGCLARDKPSKLSSSISSLFALIKTPSCDGLVPQPTARPFSSSMRAAPSSPETTATAHLYQSRPDVQQQQQHQQQLVATIDKPATQSADKVALDQCEEMRNVDCGYAYIILAVMFIINANTFGSARAYGLIFKRLARDEDQTRSLAAMPFTIMGAVENMSGPLIGHLLVKGLSWRTIVFTGTCLVSLAHLLAGLCEWSLWGQILTMGLMCGLGLSCITISSFQINNAYFVRYRSRAFGLGLTGAVFGTLYMTPVCQFTLNTQQSTKYCYLVLGLFLLPSVPLSLLLRPKPLPRSLIEAEAAAAAREEEEDDDDRTTTTGGEKQTSGLVANGHLLSNGQKPQHQQQQQQQPEFITPTNTNQKQSSRLGTWQATKLIMCKPIFHLIWPTQLLFCWFNFVISIIIADFGRDRQLDEDESSNLLLVWAVGQFFGRIFLGAIVDMNLISYKSFTIICLSSIGSSTWLLNHVTTTSSTPGLSQDYANLCISSIVFVLSMFIANLYILLNGLVLRYMETELAAMSLGLSSFLGSFFLLPRAHTIGFFREQYGAYDQMLDLFGYVAFASSLAWFLVPQLLCSNKSGGTNQRQQAPESVEIVIEPDRHSQAKGGHQRLTKQHPMYSSKA